MLLMSWGCLSGCIEIRFWGDCEKGSHHATPPRCGKVWVTPAHSCGPYLCLLAPTSLTWDHTHLLVRFYDGGSQSFRLRAPQNVRLLVEGLTWNNVPVRVRHSMSVTHLKVLVVAFLLAVIYSFEMFREIFDAVLLS